MKKIIFGLLLIGFSSFASAGNYPDEIVVNARYVDHSSPSIIEDYETNEMVISYMNTVEAVSFSFDPKDSFDLKKAATKVFVSPVLNGCTLLDYSFDYIGQGSTIFMIGARDPQDKKICQRFAKSISSGFQMKFTDVPLLNRGAVIKSVIVNVSL